MVVVSVGRCLVSSPLHDQDPKSKTESAVDDSEKKLAKAEAKINSSTHHTQWQAFKRWYKNKKRIPQTLVTKVSTEEGRANLFKDWVRLGGDVEAIIARHKQELEESNKSEIRYGFRSEKWLQDTHGETKAAKIVKKRRGWGSPSKTLRMKIPSCTLCW